MARKSRKNQSSQVVAQKEKSWKVALYARLSVEDARKKASGSIQNQVEVLEDFAKQRLNMEVAGRYVDAGKSGTNFHRPAFEQMMADIKAGQINCVIVKDLSRFGRNYIEAGDYLENIFPFLGVRFIAIQDNFDSAALRAGQAGILLPLKNLMNQVYAKDISQKITTQFVIKQNKGAFLGTFAPYGYQKSPQDHHKLEIDSNTAPIVQQIFALHQQGWGDTAISKQLNAQGILPPMEYRRIQGLCKGSSATNAAKQWHKSAVARILANPVYLGHMVQGKQKTNLFCGTKRRNLPPAQWVWVYGTHPPLVDRTAENFLALTLQQPE